MPKYNSSNDIPYFKFMEFSEAIANKGDDVDFIAEKVCEYFYPEVTENKVFYMQEFYLALLVEKKRFIPYFVRLNKLNRTDNFVNANTYSDKKMYLELFKEIVTPIFSKVENINLYEGRKIMQSFCKESTKLKSLSGIFIIRHLRLQFQ